MRRTMACLLPAAIIGLWLGASAAPPPAVVLPGDSEDLLLIDGERPFLIRLHIQLDRTSYRASWESSVAELFRYLDSNGDGVLSEQELARAPSEMQFFHILQGADELEPDPAPELGEVAGEGSDGKVTLARLAAYYRHGRAGPLTAEWITREGKVDPVSDALFRHLDRDRDGKLSPAELGAAPGVLGRLDTDADELISPGELLGSPVTEPAERYRRRQLNGTAAAPLPPLLLIDDATPHDKIVARLLARYDRDQDGHLGREEIGFDEALFQRLDTNHDAKLDQKELLAWLTGGPDLEVVVRFKGAADPLVVTLPASVGHSPTLPTEPTRHGSLLARLAGAQLDVLARDRVLRETKNNRGRLEALFRTLDANKDGVLDRREAFQPPFAVVPYLRLADSDGDGTLTWKEWSEFLDMRSRIGARTAQLFWLDRGRRLFDFLDANHDGRLSRRELASAAARLAPYAKAGGVHALDLPRQAQLIVLLGPTEQSPSPNTPPLAGLFASAPQPRGPLWFRKMDRNRDGDLSPREFLGTLEQFRKIDSDRDALIDVDEAERADAWYRKQASTPK